MLIHILLNMLIIIIYAMYGYIFIKFFEDVFFTSNGKMIKDIGTISSSNLIVDQFIMPSNI
jgi:hypothetical protein